MDSRERTLRDFNTKDPNFKGLKVIHSQLKWFLCHCNTKVKSSANRPFLNELDKINIVGDVSVSRPEPQRIHLEMKLRNWAEKQRNPQSSKFFGRMQQEALAAGWKERL